MNKVIEKNGKYFLLLSDEMEEVEVGTYFEKKSNINWIVLPKGNSSGRGYISTNKLVNGVYEFADKTSGPRTLTTWNWKSRMSTEEKEKYEAAQAYIEKIREECMSRKPIELTDEEKLKIKIQKLEEELKKLKG